MRFTPLTYPQIVALTRKASARQPKPHFTKEEIDLVNQNVEKNPFLKSVLNNYPPLKFNSLRARYYEQHRVEHQEMHVHDPIFESTRNKTREWLQALPSSQLVYDIGKFANYKATLKMAFDIFIKQDFFKKRYPIEAEQQKAVKDFQLYLDKIFEVYQEGASHPETMIYYMQWAAAGDPKKITLGKPEDRGRFEDLFMVLDDARNAYKDSADKFYPGHDWSCPPGVEERLLDMLTSIRKTTEPEEDLSTADMYVFQAINFFISSASNRSLSDNLYTVYESLAPKKLQTVYKLSLTEDHDLLMEFYAQVERDVHEMIAKARIQFENYQTRLIEIKKKAGTFDHTNKEQVDHSERLSLTQIESKEINPQQRLELIQIKRELEFYVETYFEDRLKSNEDIYHQLQEKNSSFNHNELQEELSKIILEFQSYLQAVAGSSRSGVSELFLKRNPSIHELREKIAPYCHVKETKIFAGGQELFHKLTEQRLKSLFLFTGERLEELPQSILFSRYQKFFEQTSYQENCALKDEQGNIILLKKDGSRILNHADCLLAMKEKTRLSEDYLELLTNIPISGDGLEEFNAFIESGKTGDRALEEVIGDCDQNTEKLNQLAMKYIKDYPGECGVYLSWNEIILEDLKRYIEQRPEGESLLIAQDSVLAEIVNKLEKKTQSVELKNKIFKESAEAGYLKTIMALLYESEIRELSKSWAFELAGAKGHQEILERLLEQGVNDYSKNLVLKLAAKEGKMNIVILLLASGINDDGKNRAIQSAASCGHTEIVRLLLENRVNDQGKNLAIESAVNVGNKQIVEILLDAGINDYGKNKAIESAVNVGNKEIVDILLGAGINDYGKNLVLTLAAKEQHKDIVELLLAYGINDEGKNRALENAACQGHKEIVEIILAYQITESSKNKAFREAINAGHKQIAEFFLGLGEITDESKNWALKHGATRGNKEVVEILLAHDINNDGKNQALKSAAYSRRKEMVAFLINQDGINEDSKNQVLVEAAKQMHKEIVETVIKSGFDLNVTMIDKSLLPVIMPYLTNQKSLEYLYEALERKDHQAVDVFLKRLMTLDCTKEDSKNLFFKIVANSRPEILDHYIRLFGSEDMNKLDDFGQTVLHVAIKNLNFEIVKHLVDYYHINIDIQNSSRQTAVNLAAELGEIKILDFLNSRRHAQSDSFANPVVFTPPTLVIQARHSELRKP